MTRQTEHDFRIFVENVLGAVGFDYVEFSRDSGFEIPDGYLHSSFGQHIAQTRPHPDPMS
jgi:hypothetical protein